MMNVRKRLRRLKGVRRSTMSADDRLRLEKVERRLGHLEALVEGLQDAIHRDSIRHEERMSELERKTQPDALAKALSDDARRRGL
jgi:predicted  nucleic acid-binding Zn-ribbon protein